MKHCTKCGGEIEDTAKFCTWCGAAVAPAPVPAPAAPTPAAAAAAVAATVPAAVAAAAVDAMPKPATYQAPATGSYQTPATGTYGQPYSAPQTGTYQQPTGTYQQPTTTYGQPYTSSGASYPSGAAPQAQKDTLGKVAVIFMYVSAVIALINAFTYFGYGGDYATVAVLYIIMAAVAAGLGVVLGKKINAKETISTGFKVVCLIFGSLISGILLFVRDSQNKR